MKTTNQLIKSIILLALISLVSTFTKAQCSSVGQISTLTATTSACLPASNTATVTGGLTFSSLSAGGGGTISVVLIMPSTGLTVTQTISPPYIIGGTYPFTFAGVPSNGAAFSITASFLYPGPCGMTINLVAPTACACFSDAGTFGQNIVGSTNSPGPSEYHLCYNDVLYISSNGDNAPPPDMTVGWTGGPAPLYTPGLWLLKFSCPPTVSSPNSILSDPCYLGVESSANGYWQLSNWTGVQQTVFYVPVTVYSQQNNVYAVNTIGGGYCYDLGPIHKVTYLNEIVGVSTTDCASGVVTTNISGGMPVFNGSNFNIVPGSLVPATASFVNTTCGNNGDIEISGLVNGDTYSYDVVDSKNCPITISGTYVGQALSDFTYSQQDYCIGDASQLPALGANTYVGGVFSSTPAGLFLNSSTGFIDLSFSTQGTYTVDYTTSNAACPTSSSFSINVNNNPFVLIGDQVACGGVAATFTPIVFPAVAYNYSWTVPAGMANPGNVSSIVTSTPGAYSLIITNQNTNCASPASAANLTLNPLPTVQASDVVFCVGANATLTAVTPQTGTVTYSWTVPAGVANPGDVASFTTNVAGNYSIQITDANGCVSLADVATVTMDSPQVSFNEPSICAGNSVVITATSTPTGSYTYAWNVPGGMVNPGNVNSFSTNTGGVYTVQITDNNSGCSSSVVDGYISAIPLPTVAVNSPNICIGTNATISATPGNASTYSYAWTVPSGVPAPGNVVSFTSSVAGSYSVQITDNATGCASTISTGILSINPLPTVQVSDEVFCNGVNATLTAVIPQTGAITYNWTFPAGIPAPGNVAFFTANVVGNYSVQITDANGCSSLPATAVVTIDNGPTVILLDSTICTGSNALLTATAASVGTYSYSWTVPAGVVNPGNVNSVSTGVAGSYSVQLTDLNSGCTGVISIANVTVITLPTVVVNSPSICAGSSATITATPGNASSYTYVWTVPAGVPAPGNVQSFSSSVAGSYSVQITDDVTGCVSTISTGTLTINPLPTVQVSDEEFCFGSNATLTAVTPQVGLMTYVWTVPAGVPVPGNVASFTTNVIGNYSVQITDVNGCSSIQANAIVTVDNGPTASLNDSTICVGTNALLSATTTSIGTFSYVWTVPASVVNPGNVNSISTSDAGTYSVQLTDLNSSCVGSIANGNVTVLALPTVVVNSSTICAGTNATIAATPGIPSAYTYMWTIPVGVPAPGNVQSFSSSIAGSYNVQITDDNTGCVSTISTGTITVNSLPTVQVSDEEFCFGTNATLTAVTPQIGLMTYNWTVPAGVPAPGDVASFTTNIIGNYSVQITDVNGCTSIQATAVVTVDNGPTANLNDSTICVGTNALLSATTTSIGIFSYVWTVPAGVVNPGNVNSISTNDAGVYSVQLTDLNSSCAGSIANGNVTVLALPTVVLNSSSTCAGTTATIVATPGIPSTYTYVWTVPVGVPAPGNVQSFSSAIAGSYDVQITDDNTSCASIISSGTITVNPLPTVQVSDEVFCNGTNATLTAVTPQTGTITYNWTVPVGATAPGNVASFTTNVIGSYFVQITDVNGCTSIPDTAIVTVDNGPTASLNDSTICIGDNALLTATTTFPGTYSYVWTVPAGVVNPGDINSIPTSTAGTYTVQITDVNSGCSGSIATGDVTVLALPTVVVNNSPICAGASATLSATPGNVSTFTYVWTVPATATAPGNVASFSTSIAGNYGIQITDNATGCVSSMALATQVVNPIPTVTVNSATICAGNTANISAMPTVIGNYTYDWTVPSGDADPGNVATFAASIDGVYTVVITDNLTLCSSVSNSGVLTVLLNPIIDAGIDQIGCDTDNFTLTASGAGVGGNYVWSNGIIDDVPFITPTIGLQTYTVTGTTVDGCLGTDDVGIFVDQTPVVSFNFVTDGQCAPVQAVFTNTSNPNGTNCTWTFDTGDVISNCGPLTYQFNDAGVFGVNLQVESVIAGCVSNDYQASIISVEDYPIADFVYSPFEITTLHNEVDFENTSISATNYSWNFGDNSGGSILASPMHEFSNLSGGSYLVTLLASTPGGCLDSTSVIIDVTEEELFYVPNAFTPDNNEFNNIFQPVFTSGFEPEEFDLLIFNRWGEVIFESNDPELGWDGTFGASGKILPDGIYIWKISYRTTDTNERNVLSGHVNLIR